LGSTFTLLLRLSLTGGSKNRRRFFLFEVEAPFSYPRKGSPRFLGRDIKSAPFSFLSQEGMRFFTGKWFFSFPARKEMKSAQACIVLFPSHPLPPPPPPQSNKTCVSFSVIRSYEPPGFRFSFPFQIYCMIAPFFPQTIPPQKFFSFFFFLRKVEFGSYFCGRPPIFPGPWLDQPPPPSGMPLFPHSPVLDVIISLSSRRLSLFFLSFFIPVAVPPFSPPSKGFPLSFERGMRLIPPLRR